MTINAAVAVPSHNNPPSGPEALQADLKERCAELITRKDELLAAAARVPAVIEDEVTCGRLSDFIKQIAAALKKAETKREDEKEPHLAAGRAVDGFFKALAAPLADAKKDLEKRLTVYQQKKAAEERKRREEEAQKARDAAAAAERAAAAALAEAIRQEEEAKQASADIAAANPGFAPPAATASEVPALGEAIAAEETANALMVVADKAVDATYAKPADLSRTRGEYGAVASLRTIWTFADLDREQIDLEALRSHLPADALERAVRSYIKAGGRDLRGVRIFEETSTVVR